MTVEEILRNNKELSTSMDNWRSYYQDLADYCLPRKAWQDTMRYKGDRLKFNFLYDSTAIRGIQIMAAGFHSNLTNPTTKWFKMQTRNLEYMQDKETSIWFNDVEDIMFSTLNNSNFDTSMQELYVDAGTFGTGGILILEDPKNKVRFSLPPIGKVNLVEDAQGRIVEVYFNFTLTACQAYRKWGDKAGEGVRENYKEKPNMEYEFVHHVGPREDRDVTKETSKNLPYESKWINVKEKLLIDESGFFENPYAFVRFYKDPTDVMGFSPAMNVLPDIKLVNAMMKTMLRAAMKQADPPMQAPRKGYLMPLNLNPAAINYRDPKTNADALAPINVGGGNLPITLEIVQMVQHNIEMGLFVPLFRSISEMTKQMTIPEIQRRIAESMVLLGPVIGRFTHEGLDNILGRVFNILYRNGDLPPIPEMIQGQELDIVYIGPLAKAQKESEMYSIESFLGNVAAIAQVKPGALDKIDEDKTIDIIAQIKSINPKMIRSEKEVADIRESRAQMEQAQAQLSAAQQGADIMNTAAGADKQIKEAQNVGTS